MFATMYIGKLEALIPSCLTPYVNFIMDFIIRIYFFLVYAVFGIFNFFQQKKIVKKATDPVTLISATKLAEMIRKKEIKSVDIVEAYIKRIEEVNEVINAVSLRNYDEAREKAKAIDKGLEEMEWEELNEYCSTRPLLGLPFTMKDSLSIAGKVITSGIWNRRDTVATEDAEVVQRMMEAGAILLCITTVPVVCVWIETENGITGRTKNPYDSRRTSGGSSGGEAALHGAGASLMGIGGDIAGSIRVPAFANGIFGLMPSPGLISQQGHIPDMSTDPFRAKMLRIGPMTRFAEDIEMLSEVMSNNSIPDTPSETSLQKSRIFFINGLTHYRYCEPVSWQNTHSMKLAVEHFEKNFNVVAHETTLPASRYAADMFMASFKAPGTPLISKFMTCASGTQEPANCPSELFKYFTGTSQHSLAAILQGLGDIEVPYTEEEREKLFALRDSARKGLEELLSTDGLLFFPSFPTVAPFHNELLAKQTSIFHTGFINLMCLPAIQCPMGLNNQGIPTGVMIVGGLNSDRLLIKAAQEISSAFGGWVSPGN